jgi:hypothetical protein
MNPVGGRGYWGWGAGWGRGGGWGRRNWYYATGLTGWQRAAQGMPAWGGYAGPAYGAAPTAPTAEQEQQVLKQQAHYLQQSLDEVNKRILELEKEKSD